MERGRLKKFFIFSLFFALTSTGGYFLYQQRPASLPAGLASGNGRLEAVEVDIATKIAGRLAELGPHEGDTVEAGAVDGPTGGRLAGHIFVAEKGSHYEIEDGLPQYPGWD